MQNQCLCVLATVLLNKLDPGKGVLGGHEVGIKRIDAHFIIRFSASSLCYLHMALLEIHCWGFAAFKWPNILSRGLLRWLQGISAFELAE